MPDRSAVLVPGMLPFGSPFDPPGLPRFSDYQSFVLSTLPVFYVPMQGVVTEVVRNNVASISATAPRATTGPFNQQAWRFSATVGDNDNFTIATDPSYHPGDTFSVMGWANQLGNGNSFPNWLIGNGAGGNNDMGVGVTTAGAIVLGKANVGNVFVSTATYKGTGWHHVLFTKNAGTATVCYVDGLSVAGTFTNQTISAGSANWTIGGGAGHSDDFDGCLCHVAIWKRVLTAAEAWSLYAKGVGLA